MKVVPLAMRPLSCVSMLMKTSKLSLFQSSSRSITTKYSVKPLPVPFPSDLPPSLLSQIPNRLQPNRKSQKLEVYPPPPSAAEKCKTPLAAVTESQFAILDPTSERRALFDYRRSRRSVKVGDIIRITFKNGDPFAGVCLSIRLRGVDTACLLRNAFTKVGVEMWVKVFSPNVEGVEIVQRTEKRKRRARLYYMRHPKHDLGSVENIVSNYLRQRASVTGRPSRARS